MGWQSIQTILPENRPFIATRSIGFETDLPQCRMVQYVTKRWMRNRDVAK